MMEFALSLLAFLSVWLLMLFLRANVRGLKLRPVDLLIALIPIALYMIFTGKLEELTAGDHRTVNAVHFATQARLEATAFKAPRFDEAVPFRPENPQQAAQVLNALGDRHPDGLTFKFGEFYDGRVGQQAVMRLLAQP